MDPIAVTACVIANARAATEVLANLLYPETIAIGSPFKDTDGDGARRLPRQLPRDPQSRRRRTSTTTRSAISATTARPSPTRTSCDGDSDLIGDACDPTP